MMKCIRPGCGGTAKRGASYCPPHDPAMAGCAREGCRAKAMGGSVFCVAHNPAIRRGGGAPRGNINRWLCNIDELYDRQEAIAEMFGTKLEFEVVALRTLLIKSFKEKNYERVLAIINALIKAAEVQYRLRSRQNSELEGMVDEVLADLVQEEAELLLCVACAILAA